MGLGLIGFRALGLIRAPPPSTARLLKSRNWMLEEFVWSV